MESKEVILALRDILQVLAFVHSSQVIHRDIKPANLIRRNSDRKIVLIDFGAVKALSTDSMERMIEEGNDTRSVVVGSLVYMPNEQLAGQPKFCSDIYALGILCLQAFTGLSFKELPRDAQTNEYTCALAGDRVNIKINLSLAAIIDKMVRYDYRQRYKDATENLQALAQLLNNSNAATTLTASPPKPQLQLEEPEGQVELGSRLYVQRPPIEKTAVKLCCEQVH